jgi:hypothetical protein
LLYGTTYYRGKFGKGMIYKVTTGGTEGKGVGRGISQNLVGCVVRTCCERAGLDYNKTNHLPLSGNRLTHRPLFVPVDLFAIDVSSYSMPQ